MSRFFALNRLNIKIMEAVVDSRWHFGCQYVDSNWCEDKYTILCFITFRFQLYHIFNEYFRVTSEQRPYAVC